MEIKAIATIHTGFPEKFGIPRQSGLVGGATGEIIFEPEFRNPDAVRGLEGYSHLWIIWDFSENRRENWSPTVRPPRLGGKKQMGVFATRSPFRPNPLGLSCVEIESIRYTDTKGPVILVRGVDMLNATPIYDIKPYLPHIDSHPEALGGFSTDTADKSLNVIIPPELLPLLKPEEWETVKEILSQDPRPAFINDEDRIWGLSFGGRNFKFRVKGDSLTLSSVEIIT